MHIGESFILPSGNTVFVTRVDDTDMTVGCAFESAAGGHDAESEDVVFTREWFDNHATPLS